MEGPRIATAAVADHVGRVLAEGFGRDPVLTWVFAEPNQETKLQRFFGFLAHEVLVPFGATYFLDDAVAGWTPPGSSEWDAELQDRFADQVGHVCTESDLERLQIMGEVTDAHQPPGDLWYLGVLAATTPGRGLGSRLLEASLARVDQTNLPAYLESTNPRNLGLYERHGFTVTETFELPGGPALTGMWRDPH